MCPACRLQADLIVASFHNEIIKNCINPSTTPMRQSYQWFAEWLIGHDFPSSDGVSCKDGQDMQKVSNSKIVVRCGKWLPIVTVGCQDLFCWRESFNGGLEWRANTVLIKPKWERGLVLPPKLGCCTKVDHDAISAIGAAVLFSMCFVDMPSDFNFICLSSLPFPYIIKDLQFANYLARESVCNTVYLYCTKLPWVVHNMPVPLFHIWAEYQHGVSQTSFQL